MKMYHPILQEKMYDGSDASRLPLAVRPFWDGLNYKSTSAKVMAFLDNPNAMTSKSRHPKIRTLQSEIAEIEYLVPELPINSPGCVVPMYIIAHLLSLLNPPSNRY